MKGLSFFVFIFMLLFSSCGRSPLLTHRKETVVKPGSSQNVESSESVRWIWELGPVIGENKLKLEFSKPFGNLTSISFWADMPSMNHDTSPVIISAVNDQTILISDLWLVMAGEWVLHLKQGSVEKTLTVNL